MIITRRRVLAALAGGVATVALDPFNVLGSVWAQSEAEPQPLPFCPHVDSTVRAQLKAHGADIAVCDQCLVLRVGSFSPRLYEPYTVINSEPVQSAAAATSLVSPIFRGQVKTLEDVRCDFLSAHRFSYHPSGNLKYMLISGVICNLMIFKVIQTADRRRFLTYSTLGKPWTEEEIPADVVGIFLGGLEGFNLGQRCDVPRAMSRQIGDTGRLTLQGNALVVIEG